MCILLNLVLYVLVILQVRASQPQSQLSRFLNIELDRCLAQIVYEIPSLIVCDELSQEERSQVKIFSSLLSNTSSFSLSKK
jgi:hypothetical protein